MMINKRLIGIVYESKKYIAANVIFQWLSLAANTVMMLGITRLFQSLISDSFSEELLIKTVLTIIAAAALRIVSGLAASEASFMSSRAVKKKLREMIYKKLLRLGASYNEQVKTSEVVQVAVEGVEQLETYFGSYLPQFFYSVLAPLTLFAVMCFVSVPCAVVLLICVPLIPVSIAFVQKWAKKLLSKYWDQYTALGDTFLENLQGLTTLKIYNADAVKNEEMNVQSEHFRKITMKVLKMQLNSITVMDFIAYGGAALGVILSASQLAAGSISFGGCLLIILLSADFFIPMRRLGSYFHVAMNGMAASDKIFRLLDLPDDGNTGDKEIGDDCLTECKGLSFSYDGSREALSGINMSFSKGSFTAVVGESGSGKSTLASIISGKNKNYSGSVKIGGIELSEIKEESLMHFITYVGQDSYIFKGTVSENLIIANPGATESEMWNALERANLADFLKNERGLETQLAEKGANISGGQRQRLALARALLHDSEAYIFDEATSNIDADSENDIMKRVFELAKTKTVILISHRLANAVKADNIYVLENGKSSECGTHAELLKNGGTYSRLWSAQQELEVYTKEESRV